MVDNNWDTIALMYVEVMGENNNCRWFFGIFYIFSVVISLNIIVAVILDMYSSVERLNTKMNQTYNIL